MHAVALGWWLGATLAAAPVDEWVPYPDGTPGGCYRSERGELYGCTPVTPAPVDPEAAAAAAQAELQAVRRELDELKLRQADDDARREDEATALAAEAQAARDAEQRDHDAAMAAYYAIEAAKDSVRLRELGSKTEACRKPLEARGFRIIGPGTCQAPDGTYQNCPDC